MKDNVTYIILAAGKGSNLHPLTLNYPKMSYKLDENTTLLQRMVRKIRKYDKNAEIIVVLGYMFEAIKKELYDDNVKFIINPFYETTSSIASLWFAREYLERENVAIINGDVVYDDKLIYEYIIKPTKYPYIFLDSSVRCNGAYNVTAKEDLILVMSKKLENYTGKYACLTKLDAVSARILKKEIDNMIMNNMYDQYFENSLVQMIMFHDFQLYYIDIKNYNWSEVNSVDDLLEAQKIHYNLI